MSGIYIPGMEMPKDGPLIFKINTDGTISTTWKNGYKKYTAIPVPDHGRLAAMQLQNDDATTCPWCGATTCAWCGAKMGET